jgi:hypothetical protein
MEPKYCMYCGKKLTASDHYHSACNKCVDKKVNEELKKMPKGE